MNSPSREERAPTTREGDARTCITRGIKAVCTKLAVAERDQNAWLQEALGIGYSSVWRKLSGEAAWTDVDLGNVARAAHMPFADLLLVLAREERLSVAQEDAPCPGTVVIGGREVACEITLGEALSSDHNADIVAVKRNGEWFVVAAEDAAGEEAKKLSSVVLRSGEVARFRIALLDDDEDLAATASAVLAATGLHVTVFSDASQLQAALETGAFDAFILDWWLKGQTAESTIAFIRSRPEYRSSPIVIVTGELVDGGRAQESDLSRVVKAHACKAQIKPVYWKLVAAEIGIELGPA